MPPPVLECESILTGVDGKAEEVKSEDEVWRERPDAGNVDLPPIPTLFLDEEHPLVCPKCGVRFDDRSGLRQHLETYTEKARRHQCTHPGCHAAARYPKDLTRHLRIHNKPEAPPFPCEELGCDRGFSRKDNLLRHLRDKHANSPTSLAILVASPTSSRRPRRVQSRSSNKTVLSSSEKATSSSGLDSSGDGVLQSAMVASELSHLASSLEPSISETTKTAQDERISIADHGYSLLPLSAAQSSQTLGTFGRWNDGRTDLGFSLDSSVPVLTTPSEQNEHYLHTLGSGGGQHTFDQPRGRQNWSLERHESSSEIVGDKRYGVTDSITQDIFRNGFEGIVRAKAYTSRSTSAHSTASSAISRASMTFSDYSVASSATSLGSYASMAQHTRLIDNMTKSLFCIEELDVVLNAACKDVDIGVERLQKNARRLIQHFGKDLRSEVTDKTQLDTARAMKTPRLSSYAARTLMQHLEGDISKSGNDADRNLSGSSSDTLDEDDENELSTTEYCDIHDFLYNSEAYCVFGEELLDFAHKPYEKRILSAMGHDLMEPSGSHLQQDAIQHIAREISWVPTKLLTFSHDADRSRIDAMKACVEDYMGETWNWWPLAPRLHCLHPGHCRLKWKSPRGTPRHLDLPETVKAALQQAIKTAPAFVNIDLPSSTRTHLSCNHGNSKTSTTGSTPAASQPVSGSTTSATTSSGLPSQHQQIRVPAPVAKPGSQTATQISQAQHVTHHLSLCVVSSSRKFVSLRCDDLDSDVQFFAKMRTSYDKARGWPRLWLSMWQYKYSEFVMFHKYGVRRGARVDVGFPNDQDTMYQFLPRKPHPAPPKGPITPEQFEDHYYNDHCPCWYDWRRYQLSYRGHFNKVNRVALDAVPKRVVRINMDDGIDEHFYGLYAREERNFLRVAIYACLCNIPGVIFFFLWLFHWYHGSDLQNASVPLTLSLSLTLGFAAVVFGTRDGN